jgi:hypothetical protein
MEPFLSFKLTLSYKLETWVAKWTA